MTTRYQERHYEDVARLLRPYWGASYGGPLPARLVHDFADLFAADNPPACIDCGCRQGSNDHDPECSGHLFAGGFDRERFLAACGLESEGDA